MLRRCDDVRARVYVKRKRRGRRANVKEGTSNINNRKQSIGAEGSSPKAVGDSVGINISKQPRGAPDGSISVAERTTDMQQKFRSMLEKMEIVKRWDTELASEDWSGDSKEDRSRELGEGSGHFLEAKKGRE